MSDKEKGVEKEPKKRRSSFWYIAIAGIALIIVYQSGRSSGIRSVTESLERSAVTPQEAPRTNIPPTRQESPAASPETPRPAPNRAANPQPADRPASQNRAAANISASVIPPSQAIPSGPPPLLPSAIAPADPGQIPHPAPVFSIYERQPPPAGSVRPSELGLMPLAPLEPLPATFQQTSPAPVRSPVPVLCDCGVIH